MKVRVCFTVDVDDDMRRAIAYHFGDAHPATRAEIKQWYEDAATSLDADAYEDYVLHAD